MKQGIIKPALPDIMLLRLSVSLLPGRRNADLGGCMSTAVDWKWRIKLLIVLSAQQNMCMDSLEAIASLHTLIPLYFYFILDIYTEF